MSQIAKRIAGTLVEDEPRQLPALSRWVQDELRAGALRRHVAKFAEAQQENLDVDLVQIVEVKPDSLVCRIPCCVADHESPHPFRSEVVFDLNPLSGVALRR